MIIFPIHLGLLKLPHGLGMWNCIMCKLAHKINNDLEVTCAKCQISWFRIWNYILKMQIPTHDNLLKGKLLNPPTNNINLTFTDTAAVAPYFTQCHLWWFNILLFYKIHIWDKYKSHIEKLTVCTRISATLSKFLYLKIS